MMSLRFSLGRMILGCSPPSFSPIIQVTIARPSLDETFVAIVTVDHCDLFLLDAYCSDFHSKPVSLPGLSLRLTWFGFGNYTVLSAISFLVDKIITQCLKANLNYFLIHMLLVVRWLLLPALQLLAD